MSQKALPKALPRAAACMAGKLQASQGQMRCLAHEGEG